MPYNGQRAMIVSWHSLCRRILLVPILIDGHNLIGQLPGLSLQDPDDEEMLVRQLQSYRARTGKRLTVVFDAGTGSGLAQSRSQGGVEVVFAGQGSSADAVIARRMRNEPNPGAWLVITSDRDVAERVRRQGARVQSSVEFTAELGALGEKEPDDESPDWRQLPPTSEEVEQWLGLFGEQD